MRLLELSQKKFLKRIGFSIASLAFITNYCFSQNVDADMPLATKLKTEFGSKTKVAALSSRVIISFDRTKTVKDNFVQAIEETDERLISLADDYTFVTCFGTNDYCDLSMVQVYDKKDQPVYTPVFDMSSNDQMEFYSDDKIRAFQIHLDAMGQKTRYNAQEIISDLKYMDVVPFREDRPILNDSLIIYVPDWLDLDIKETNLQEYNIQKTISEDPTTKEKMYIYTAKNIKALNEDKYIPGMEYLLPQLLLSCKSYKNLAGNTVNVMGSVSDLYMFYEKLVNEAGNKPDELKPLVNEIIKGKTTDEQKIKAIYYWVEDNIRYLAFENDIAGLKPDACQNVMQKKYGDCKGMANLLVEMLKIAGFDAHRTWIGTKGIIYDLSTPSLADHNHCICTLFYNGKHYYLDATEKYASFGDNADRIEGRQVLIENGDKYIVENIPGEPIERNKEEINKTMQLSDDILTGRACYKYNGESKTGILSEYNNVTNEDRKEILNYLACKKDPNVEITSITTSDLQNREVPVVLDYSFNLKNHVNKFDNDIYVDMVYDKQLPGPAFDSTYDGDCYKFNYRICNVINDTLLIPSGYTVKHLSPGIDISTDKYIFKITYTQAGDKVVYHKEIKILKQLLKKTEFKAWNEAIKQLKNVDEDQVILSKI